MEEDRYVAYIGTYTKEDGGGIHIMDFDAQNNRLSQRCVIPANNPSCVLVNRKGTCLYTTTDQGVNAYRILPDGGLDFLNSAWTGGMRGCYLETDPADRLLFVAGYYDGRVSVMHLEEDGRIGEIADGVFHQGMGADEFGHDFMPHVTCVRLTPDEQGIFAVDNGLDQVKVYDFDAATGALRPNGVIRCELDSQPRLVQVDRNKKFFYILCERTNHVCVYETPTEWHVGERELLEPIQKITTIAYESDKKPASFGMDLAPDGKHLFVSNTVTNTAVVYDVDSETGMLALNCCASLSGEYPKAIAALPDCEHFVALGKNTGTVTIYHVNYADHYFLMSAKPLLIEQPGSICIHRLNG